MPTWYFRPVKRDKTTPTGGTEREFRSKVAGVGATGQAKRGTVVADQIRTIPTPGNRGYN